MSTAADPRGGIRHKIRSAFVLQLLAISIATVLGVLGASAVLQDLLIHRALLDEAAHVQRRLEADPRAPMPDTYNLRGYLLSRPEELARLPARLAALPPGYHDLPADRGGSLALVQDLPQGRLVLEFQQEQVGRLAFYFGFIPLAGVLLVIYLAAWLTYRISRRAVSPVTWLAGEVRRWDPRAPDFTPLAPDSLPLDVDGEVAVLARALHGLGERLGRFVERERSFTRDASHELRTPLTVIRMACDLLQAEGALDARVQRTVARIQAAVRDMEALIEALLILAREDAASAPGETFVVNDVATEEVEKLRPLFAGKGFELDVVHRAFVAVRGSPRALGVMLGNLVRNACQHTEQGHVKLIVEAGRILVEDTGCGIAADELDRVFDPYYRSAASRHEGHGIGLSIVRRLAMRFGWPVRLESEPGRGTRAIIELPDHQPAE
ncbi:MAG: sensor histidine kinase [Lysobacteraceae bacterium]|nr:MAG: sensor histidine kinase [Xanthomonadaceae bacterium]